MDYSDLENELQRLRAGRLLDEQLAEAKMSGLGRRAVTSFYLRMTSSILGRRRVPIQRMPKLAQRAARVLGTGLAPPALTTFHFHLSAVSRPRSAPGRPSSVKRGERVAVFPSSDRHFAIVNRNKPAYSNRERVITVPAGRPFLKSRIGKYLTSRAAEVDRHLWLSQKSVVAGRRSPVEFQTYIDRSDLKEPERSKELAADKDGYISFGNTGATPGERAAFWSHVDNFETREGARLQSRIEAELPHWLDPEDFREIAQRLCIPLAKRRLPHWCAVHLPGPDGDSRNHHLHVAWHDRPVIGGHSKPENGPEKSEMMYPAGPVFAKEKDRDVQKKYWVDRLRKTFAEIVNDVIAKHAIRTGERPPHFFYPGSNKDLGINEIPQRHRGPRRSAIERAGSRTSRGTENELAIRHRLALTEAEASVELLRYIRILDDPAAFGLRLLAQKGNRPHFALRIYLAMNKAWDAVRGIELLNRALEAEKSKDALTLLTDELRGAGYVFPENVELPKLPIVRDRYSDADARSENTTSPTQARPTGTNDIDDDLVQQYGHILSTAHVYFLNELNNARLEVKRLTLAYVDPKHLPSKRRVEFLIASTPVTDRERNEIRAINRLVSIIREKSKDIEDRIPFLPTHGQQIVTAIKQAAKKRLLADQNGDQLGNGASRTSSRAAQAIDLFYVPKSPPVAPKEATRSIELASEAEPTSTQKAPPKADKQPVSTTTRRAGQVERLSDTSRSKPARKVIYVDQDLPRPEAEYFLLSVPTDQKEQARIRDFLREISDTELHFVKFYNEETLYGLKRRYKPEDEALKEFLRIGADLDLLVRNEFYTRSLDATAAWTRLSFQWKHRKASPEQQLQQDQAPAEKKTTERLPQQTRRDRSDRGH